MRVGARRGAQIGITVQFVALVRTLAEFLRLEHGSALAFFKLGHHLVVGALIAATLCWTAVMLYFLERFRSVLLVSILTVIVLLVYKLRFMA